MEKSRKFSRFSTGDLRFVLISKYSNGYVCGGYDAGHNLIMDGEAKETPQEAVNSLLYCLNNPLTDDEGGDLE